MKKYFRRKQQELYHAYSTSSALGHSVSKGDERELITRQFLSSHMPHAVQIDRGILVDQDTANFAESLSQKTSPQLDILLVMSDQPQLTLYGGSKMFFAESVVAVIEVKTTLTSAEIDRILEHCKKVKERKRQVLGLYFRESDDPSTAPSDRIPYYVVAFDSQRTALQIMEALKQKGSQMGLSTEQEPDGIFTLNPTTGTFVLKDIGLHQCRTDLQVPPFYGGEVKEDSLCVLWFTLIAQVESVRLLNFPHKSYIKKLFSTR